MEVEEGELKRGGRKRGWEGWEVDGSGRSARKVESGLGLVC